MTDSAAATTFPRIEDEGASARTVAAGRPLTTAARGAARGYVPELDGLRGFAIAAVMIFHADVPYLKGGFIGVDIFFVLSGFLITALLVQEFDRRGSITLKNFYLRRVLRLGPALVCLLLVLVTMSFIVFDRDRAWSTVIDAVIVLCYMTNWAAIFNLHSPDLVKHTWSLSIEEQFYMLWPVILILLLRTMRSRRRLAITVSSLGIAAWLLRVYLASTGSSVERLYAGLDTRADALLIGCAVGIVMSSNLISDGRQRQLARSVKYVALLSAVALIVIARVAQLTDMRMYYWVLFVVEVLTATVILHIVLPGHSLLKSVLSARVAVWLGGISYGLYLWHYPIYRVMYAFKFRGLAILLIGTCAAIAVAAASFYVIERPILAFKKKLSLNPTLPTT